jgi:hypothetical protein
VDPAALHGDDLLADLTAPARRGIDPAAIGLSEPLAPPPAQLVDWMRTNLRTPAVERFEAAVHRYFDGTQQRTPPAYAMAIAEALAGGAPERWSQELESTPYAAMAFRGLWEAFRSSESA